MPFNGKKVADIAKKKKIKAKDFKAAAHPGRTGAFNWGEIVHAKNPNSSTVEAIADLLDCSMDVLFDREDRYQAAKVSGDNNQIGNGNVSINTDPAILMEVIRHQSDIINRQDRTIEELNRKVDKLIELAKNNR